jgi:preprotein translocase subunit SecG
MYESLLVPQAAFLTDGQVVMRGAAGQEFQPEHPLQTARYIPRSPTLIMWFLVPALLVIHIFVCLLLVLAVLMQLPRSEGLGTAFGGNMMNEIAGSGAASFLSRFTVWLGVAFFAITLLLAVAYSHTGSGNRSLKEKLNAPAAAAPAATATPVASPVALPSAAPSVAPAASPVASPVPAQP